MHNLHPDLVPVHLPPVLAYIMGVDVAPRRSVERLLTAANAALLELYPIQPEPEPVDDTPIHKTEPVF